MIGPFLSYRAMWHRMSLWWLPEDAAEDAADDGGDRPGARKRERTRDEIEAAALRLFDQNGFEATTIE